MSQEVFSVVLRTSSGRRLGNVLKKSDFHFRPIYDVFETKIKTSLWRDCVNWDCSFYFRISTR